ncbi:hypothetical protein [Agrococcus carbonis]|uniref:DUF4175 domain-containing protein n=1 Tax=Agrococcus carbonis TaxID=684552 RepID=A0A1H1PAN7_9MICO|nr:hypothetical protein [Agrococcus carbonis]SDS08075.1 hypothetical protein SAMN04489719_1494 [Agrococcus carbonis]
MYAALWRALPGPWPVRLLIVLVLLAAVAYLLVFHVYPWVMQEFFPTPDPVLDAHRSALPGGPA